MSQPIERPSEKHKWMAWPIGARRDDARLRHVPRLPRAALLANVAIEEMMQDDSTDHVGDSRLGCPARAK